MSGGHGGYAFDTVRQDDGHWITTCRSVPGIWGSGSTSLAAYRECRAVLDDMLGQTDDAACSCEWTPGIDLPTTECDLHRNDPSLAHGTDSATGGAA